MKNDFQSQEAHLKGFDIVFLSKQSAEKNLHFSHQSNWCTLWGLIQVKAPNKQEGWADLDYMKNSVVDGKLFCSLFSENDKRGVVLLY